MKRTYAVISALLVALPSILAHKWPSPQHDTLERLIYEGLAPDGRALHGVLGECAQRNFGPNSTTVAAQWLRFAFHDAATFNADTKTGGVDGSIHFEMDRPENVGDGLKLSSLDYSIFHNKYVSKADVIAIGAAFAVANCGGPVVPLRGGRIDAEHAGAPGVPEPHQTLEEHIEKFRLQGFNSSEMIELVACGHTIGGVESIDFPTIVDPPANPRNSVVGFFDNTTSFDTVVVSQYLDGTTQNPLVVGHNDTTRSDLRIFNSDSNVTMRSLADPNVFRQRCAVMFQRMLGLVPGDVELTEQIEVLQAKPTDAAFKIIDGQLTFYAALRLSQPASKPFPDPSHVSFLWCDRYGDAADCRSGFANRIKEAITVFNGSVSPIASTLGLALPVAPFQAPIDASRSISHFWFEVNDGSNPPTVYNNDGAMYPVLQDRIIHPSALTKDLNPSSGGSNKTFFITAAVRSDLQPSRVYSNVLDHSYNDKPVGTVTNITHDLARDTSLQGAPGYQIYSAKFRVSGQAPILDLHLDVNGEHFSVDLQPLSGRDLHTSIPVGTVDTVPYTPPPPKSNNGTNNGTDNTPSFAISLSPPSLIVLLSWVICLSFF